MTLTVDFCGEIHALEPGITFSIGREADLAIDDNPFLHRRFLVLSDENGWWMLSNVGSLLTATVADASGHFEALLAPGASLPIVFDEAHVSFTAGPTTYSLMITNATSTFVLTPPTLTVDDVGGKTIGTTQLTRDQLLLVVALAEPRLVGDGRASVSIPSSSEAAQRLHWAITKFNRKLDNVCQKLERLGVRGLHGGPDRLASNRRARLVEYAVATRLVTKAELVMLADNDRRFAAGATEESSDEPADEPADQVANQASAEPADQAEDHMTEEMA